MIENGRQIDTSFQKIVYCSPYFNPSVPSGANRRFHEICKRLSADFGENFTIIVARGMTPERWGKENVVEVDYKFNHLSKFLATKQIAEILDRLPPSIVIMESIPIPFRALKRH